MGRLRWVLIAAIAIVIGILGVVVFWVLRLGVRPLKRMTRTAGAIAAGDLSQRVPAEADGTEARELGDALNGMLTTIEGAFAERAASEARLRRFVADASHELRTPVTTIRGYAELYRHGGPVRTRRPRPGDAPHRAGVGAHGVAGRRPAAAGPARRGPPARPRARRPRACSPSMPPPTRVRWRPTGSSPPRSPPA